MLEGLAIITGGTVISDEKGMKLDAARLEDLGKADKVNIDKDNTTIVNGSGKKKNRLMHELLRSEAQIETTTSDYDKEKLAGECG